MSEPGGQQLQLGGKGKPKDLTTNLFCPGSLHPPNDRHTQFRSITLLLIKGLYLVIPKLALHRVMSCTTPFLSAIVIEGTIYVGTVYSRPVTGVQQKTTPSPSPVLADCRRIIRKHNSLIQRPRRERSCDKEWLPGAPAT